MTDLRFSGDIGILQGLVLALVVAGAGWGFYFHQLRQRRGLSRIVLPSLRATAIFLLVTMLTQPVLHHRRVIGELGRLIVVIDGSRSMNVTDPDTDAARKVLSVDAQGRIEPKTVNRNLWHALGALEDERLQLDHRLSGAADPADLRARFEGFQAAVDGAMKFSELLPANIGAVTAEPGVVHREIWLNIPGNTLDAMDQAKAWERQPEQIVDLHELRTPTEVADNYGSRIRGFVHPPQDGEYRFYIYGDDQSRLYLNLSGTRGDLKLVAQVPEWTEYERWDKVPEQQSAPIRLQQGKRYAFEILQKEGQANDHVAVGWQLPDGSMELPIPGGRISSLSVDADQSAAAFLAQLQRELTAAKAAAGEPDPGAFRESLRIVSTTAAALETALRERLYAELRQAAAGDPQVAAAVMEFDRTSRWRRLQAMLFEGSEPLLEQLASRHEVELAALNGDELSVLWRSRAGRLADSAEVPAYLASTPISEVTDLAKALEVEPSAQKTAVLLLTDGQQNHGGSPIQPAKILGNRGVEVFTVGYGSERPPQDLAIQDLQVAESVYVKDRVKGVLEFLDTMAPGHLFSAAISADGMLLWQQELQTSGSGRRRVEFDFPLEAYVQKLLGSREGKLVYHSIPVTMQVTLSYVEGDRNRQNNQDSLHFLAVTRKRRVLLIDERPRWEWRYLAAMFDRDEKWETTKVLPQITDNLISFKRGKEGDQLPASREDLFNYDLVILGDVPVRLFRDQELVWLREFVEQRGGGLILIDGQRGNLKALTNGVTRILPPVTWNGTDGHRDATRLELTAAGKQVAALDLGSAKLSSEKVWAKLPAPHWLADAKPLPGTEVLAEAVGGDRRIPLLVCRRVGSGKVLYCASGDLWRWRYRRGDEFHQRFWNQLADWTMERPFSVQDEFVAIDAGPGLYAAGDRADLRVRLRDHHGKAMINAKAEAVLTRDGQVQTSVPLVDDGTGLYRARTASLEPGSYTVKVNVKGIDSENLKAQARFAVKAPHSRELADLACNTGLLRELSLNSGGAYLREEQLRNVVDRLERLSSGRVEETDTALWQSYWYFVLVVLLLTVEWIWRKRKGLL